MIVTEKNCTMYPASAEYNTILVINEVARIVKDAGGIVKPAESFKIVNRTVDESIRKAEEHLEKCKNNKRVVPEYIAKCENEINDMKAIKNDPVSVNYPNYISFVLDGFYYYLQADENPFFPTEVIKAEIINGKYKSCYLENLDVEWFANSFWEMKASREDITEAANLIYNALTSRKPCGIVRDRKKMRVRNHYDGGYHYETVTQNQKWYDVDFIKGVDHE